MKAITFLETFGHCRGCRGRMWTPGITREYREWTGFTKMVLDHAAESGHTVVITPIARTVYFFDGRPDKIEAPTKEDYGH